MRRREKAWKIGRKRQTEVELSQHQNKNRQFGDLIPADTPEKMRCKARQHQK